MISSLAFVILALEGPKQEAIGRLVSGSWLSTVGSLNLSSKRVELKEKQVYTSASVKVGFVLDQYAEAFVLKQQFTGTLSVSISHAWNEMPKPDRETSLVRERRWTIPFGTKLVVGKIKRVTGASAPFHPAIQGQMHDSQLYAVQINVSAPIAEEIFALKGELGETKDVEVLQGFSIPLELSEDEEDSRLTKLSGTTVSTFTLHLKADLNEQELGKLLGAVAEKSVKERPPTTRFPSLGQLLDEHWKSLGNILENASRISFESSHIPESMYAEVACSSDGTVVSAGIFRPTIPSDFFGISPDSYRLAVPFKWSQVEAVERTLSGALNGVHLRIKFKKPLLGNVEVPSGYFAMKPVYSPVESFEMPSCQIWLRVPDHTRVSAFDETLRQVGKKFRFKVTLK